MSKTLDFIKSHNFGYKIHEYDDKNILLKDVLNLELINLGNVDIPYYLKENNIIDLDIYNITDDEFENMKEGFYQKWLKINKLEDTEVALKMYRADCNMRKYQFYMKHILNDIVMEIESKLNCKSSSIDAIWLDSCMKEDNVIYKIPNEYVVLSDMDELGVLIAYNNSFNSL